MKCSLAGLGLAVLLQGASLSAAAETDLYRTHGPWVDERGQVFDLNRQHGAWTVMSMAYGACRRICSTSLRVMQALQNLADKRRTVVDFVIVGLDPAEDTPADWATFKADHHLPQDNWHFLSGNAPAVDEMTRQLGVHYWRYDGHIMHDYKIALISPDGRVVRSLTHFDDDLRHFMP